MKKQNKKIFAIIFAISLLLNIVLLSRCSDARLNVAEQPQEIKPVWYENTSVGNNDGLVIQTVAENIEDGSITLTATVSPSDAENQEVDWSAAWKSGASKSNEDVTEYVTVTPIEDGSNIAKVKCLKAFPGDQIIITVRTRVGGFTAECTCSYVGSPTGLSIEIDEALYKHDDGANLDIITLGAGQTYNFDLSLFNSFGKVDDSYNPNYEITHEGIGSFKVQFISTSQAGSNASDIDDRTLDDFVNKTVSGLQNYLTYSLNGNSLQVQAQNSIKKLVNITASGSTYTRGWYFKEYSGIEPYLKITVRETTSNISKSMYIRVVSSVSGVTLNRTTITF